MTSSDRRCALLSVSDKRGLVPLARALADTAHTLLSTGGTARTLREAGLEVVDVASHTGAEEMMGGRVKTLHPTVHGGILGRRGEDDAVMRERGIAPIDVVVVNLYPFAETVARPDVTFEEAIENIDIGGPAMVRSAAKNHASVAVLTDPDDYPRFAAALTLGAGDRDGEGGEEAGADPSALADGTTGAALAALRFDLAVKAFEHTARYDAMIADHLGRLVADGPGAPASDFPRTLNRQYTLIEPLRYGENPHQRAAFYRSADAAPDTIAGARVRQGRALSYNNVMDADAALGCVRAFPDSACVIVKHANPCGVALGATQLEAYDKAHRTDPTSAFGGIIAFNRPLEAATAREIVARQFVEVVIAPGVADEALAAFEGKPGVRVLDCGAGATPSSTVGEGTSSGARPVSPAWQLRPVSGGVLVQEEDGLAVEPGSLRTVSRRAPSEAELRDLMFAWRVAKFVKSNAIVYARGGATVGVGAGQMSRVYSARIAGIKAADEGIDVPGAVMASDAFFPFRDGIDGAAEAGIAAVIQPGGSKRDEEVIAAADEHGMAMVFTGIRHFRH